MNARWWAEIAVVRSAFDALPLGGDVVELAPGTGYWTELLAGRATSITALDGSAEMIAINRAGLGALSTKAGFALEVAQTESFFQYGIGAAR